MRIFHDTDILSMFSILTILLIVSLTDTFRQRDMKKQIESLETSVKELNVKLNDLIEPPLPKWEEN